MQVPAGAALAIKLSVRRTCVGGGHNSGTVRLWYNGAAIDTGSTRSAGSRFDATIDGVSTDYFLRTGLALSATAGTAQTFVGRGGQQHGSPVPPGRTRCSARGA